MTITIVQEGRIIAADIDASIEDNQIMTVVDLPTTEVKGLRNQPVTILLEDDVEVEAVLGEAAYDVEQTTHTRTWNLTFLTATSEAEAPVVEDEVEEAEEEAPKRKRRAPRQAED